MNEINTSKESNTTTDQTAEQQLIAEQISALLNNPNVPEPIRESLSEGLVETYNSHIDQTECNNYQHSPGYIEALLRGFKVKNN